MSLAMLPLQQADEIVPCAGSEVYRGPQNRRLRHGLSKGELAHVAEHGWVILRGRFHAQDVAAWHEECQRILGELIIDPNNLRMEDVAQDARTGRAVPWKLEPIVDLSPVFSALVRDRRICDALASLYGGREPRLFKDKILFKPPGAPGNNLHQDGAYWQGFAPSLYSVMIAVDAATAENGCTRMYDGWKSGLLTEAGRMLCPDPALVDARTRCEVLTQPGDIAIFHQFVPHDAESNRGDDFRRQIFLTYNDSADGEWYQAHRDHLLWYRTRDLADADRQRRYFR